MFLLQALGTQAPATGAVKTQAKVEHPNAVGSLLAAGLFCQQSVPLPLKHRDKYSLRGRSQRKQLPGEEGAGPPAPGESLYMEASFDLGVEQGNPETLSRSLGVSGLSS